jgi:hypothetical protein
MAQNYAMKFADKALAPFAAASVTQGVFSAQYEFTGVNTIYVPKNDTVALGAYTISAGYGTPTLIGNTLDTLTLSQDQAFAGLLDKRMVESSNLTIAAGSWLADQMTQVVTPTIDKYAFAALFTACPSGQISASAAITTANAFTSLQTANALLDESYVPTVGRVLFASPAFLNVLRLDANFLKASDLGQQVQFNGQVGEVDGLPVIKVPDAIMNATDNHIDYMVVHRSAVAQPVKLADFDIVEKSERYSGSLVNGRLVWDTFLLDSLNKGIYIHKHAG